MITPSLSPCALCFNDFNKDGDRGPKTGDPEGRDLHSGPADNGGANPAWS